jgi:hypothetical protein
MGTGDKGDTLGIPLAFSPVGRWLELDIPVIDGLNDGCRE